MSSRDRFGGNGVACGSLADLRFTVDGGDGGLEQNQGLISIFTPDLLLLVKRIVAYLVRIRFGVSTSASSAPGEARLFLRGDTPREV